MKHISVITKLNIIQSKLLQKFTEVLISISILIPLS